MENNHKYTVGLTKIIKEFNLEVVYEPENMEDILIYNNEVNRPSLQMAGFFDYFDNTRMQIIGRVETSYLNHLNDEERASIHGHNEHIRLDTICRTAEFYMRLMRRF